MPTLPALTEQLRRSVRSVVGSGLLFHSPEAVCSLDRCFRKLRSWVDGALEQYRCELAAVLYPIFVRSYLELVHRELPDDAADFMEAHRADFGDSVPELTALAAVRTPQQVADSEIARTYWTGSFELKMSAYSFELLVAFVQAEQLLPFLQLLNGEHFTVVITRRAPPLDSTEFGAGAPDDGRGMHTAARIFGRVEAVNAQQATLGPLEELQLEHDAIRAEQSGAASADAPAAAAAGRAKRAPAKRARDAGGGGGAAVGAAGLAAARSRIPLPAWSRAVEEQLVLDALHRVPLSDVQLPSCCLATLLNARDSVNCAAFSNDVATLASGHADSTILLSSLRRLREQQQFTAAGGTLAPDEPPAVRTLVGHSGPVFALSFSRDDRFVLSASQDGSARLWSTSDSAKLAGGSCLVCYRGHGFPVWDVAFSPLGYYFATASHDSTARLWATDKLSPLRIFVGHLSDVHVRARAARSASPPPPRAARARRRTDRRVRRAPRARGVASARSPPAQCVRFHPNSNYLLTGSSDSSLRLWDVSSGSCVRLLCGHTGAVTAVALSADGRYAASGSEDATVRLWDLGSGKEVCAYKGHTGAVWSVTFSHDEPGGGLLASGGADSAVRLWVRASRTPVAARALSRAARPRRKRRSSSRAGRGRCLACAGARAGLQCAATASRRGRRPPAARLRRRVLHALDTGALHGVHAAQPAARCGAVRGPMTGAVAMHTDVVGRGTRQGSSSREPMSAWSLR